MDSSSVTPANNNSRGDASLAMDADLISVTQTLAKEAYVLFQLGKYVECLKVLNQILEKKTDDPKVLHNIAIVENFQDGFSNPKRFLEALYNLKKRNERLAHSSGENTEAINNRTKALANKANNNVLPHGITADDFDVSVIMFNIAVILYHLHEYEKSFSILERLYQNIEPIDERVARHVCLLLLDVSLVCHHASRAADVINYLERVGGNTLTNQTDSATFLQQQQQTPTNLVPKSTSAPTNITISSSSDPVDPTNGPESPLSRTLSEETLYESLISTLDIPTPTRPSNHLTQLDDPLITTPDLRLKVHLYKVYALILTRNLKSAKREVKLAMNIARGKDYSLALFLKSQLEYARQNHRKAIKLLMASLGQTESTSSLYYNNLGCIYYQLSKYQTSALFFSKALSNTSLQKKEKEKTMKLSSFSNDKSVLFAYNCGLVYLATNKPILAVKCFQQAGTVFLKKPLLWLRIAECCIMFNEKKNEIDVNVIGRGKWRHLVIGNSKSSVQVDPNLSLNFAKSCLLNALHLLDTGDSNGDAKTGNSNGDAKELKAANTLLQNSINEYEGLCGKENNMILQAVLADLAFVYLELGNAVKALAAARTLLKLPECSRVYAFLANVYAAEVYCLLNDPKRASEHLSVYMNNTELPYCQQDCDMWQTRKSVENDENALSENQPEMFLKPKVARAVLFANVAAIAAAEGDIDRAEEALGVALTVIPENVEVVLTATYIDLARGKTRDAVGKLKQCSRVRFLNGK